MTPAPWYVVLKAALCNDCNSDTMEMAVDLCAEHSDEPIDAVEERAVLGMAIGGLLFVSLKIGADGRGKFDEMLSAAQREVERYDQERDG